MNQLQFGHHCIGFSVDQQEVMTKNVLFLLTFSSFNVQIGVEGQLNETLELGIHWYETY